MSEPAKDSSTGGMSRKELGQLLKRIRAERGDMVKTASAQHKLVRKTRKAIEQAMAAGPLTIPALAEATGLSSEDVLWHVSAMRKYGRAAEAKQDDDWPAFQLVTPDTEESSS